MGLIRRLSPEDSEEALRWLSDVSDKYAGFDPSGWDDSVWVLHAMYEWEGAGTQTISYHDERQQLLASGAVEPDVRGGVNLDEGVINTGVPLGRTSYPGAGWSRLLWTEYADRLSIDLGSGVSVPPSHRWFPIRSWPTSIRPPGEGSLDDESFRSIIRTIESVAPDNECFAFYAAIPTGDYDHSTLFKGPLSAIPQLLDPGRGVSGFAPNNMWPSDRSWYVYTDADLWATRVSGPTE